MKLQVHIVPRILTTGQYMHYIAATHVYVMPNSKWLHSDLARGKKVFY